MSRLPPLGQQGLDRGATLAPIGAYSQLASGGGLNQPYGVSASLAPGQSAPLPTLGPLPGLQPPQSPAFLGPSSSATIPPPASLPPLSGLPPLPPEPRPGITAQRLGPIPENQPSTSSPLPPLPPPGGLSFPPIPQAPGLPPLSGFPAYPSSQDPYQPSGYTRDPGVRSGHVDESTLWSRPSSVVSQMPPNLPHATGDSPPESAATMEMDMKAGALYPSNKGSQAAGIGTAKTFVEDYATGAFFEASAGDDARRSARARWRRRRGGYAAQGQGEAQEVESEQILAKDMAKSAFRAILQLSGVVHGVLAGISLVFLVGIVLQMEDLSDGRADAFLTYWGRSLSPLNSIFHLFLCLCLGHTWYLLSAERRSASGDSATKRQRLWVMIVLLVVALAANVGILQLDIRMTWAARRFELIGYENSEVRLKSAAEGVVDEVRRVTKAVVAEEFRDDVATWHAGNVVRCVAGLVAWVVYCVYVTNR